MTPRGTKYWNSGTIPLIGPEILGDIISEISDLAMVISETGTILSVLVNPLQDFRPHLEDWEGKDVRETLAPESVAKLDTRLADFLENGPSHRPIELNHAEGPNGWEFPIRYSLHRIGPDGSILMLGRDLRPIAEMQQQLVRAQISLEQDFETQRESDARFRMIMERTNEAFAIVSLRTGRVTDSNTVAASLLGMAGDDLQDAPFAPEFELRKRGDVMEALSAQAIADRPMPVQVTSRKSGTHLRIIPTMFRASGERLLMCRIEPEEGGSIIADSLSSNLAALYQQGPDSIVFTDAAGKILAANESFLNLIEAAHDLSVKGRTLGDYLMRGSVDLKVLTENAARSGRMRAYPTKVVGAFGTPRTVEIAVTCIQAGDSSVFAHVIRDASRTDHLRPVRTPVTDDNVRSVMELVGSASLKDIVAETTNVVEKMCIETAVELTMNNRVAAAEMLGLSRQSLYVKLRKYGLLARDDPS
ncbi:transcriptional regulator PpsR [Flavimaricola marinus]|nr:transcriptional regulator PpsR [Flavimaricola marinus]